MTLNYDCDWVSGSNARRKRVAVETSPTRAAGGVSAFLACRMSHGQDERATVKETCGHKHITVVDHARVRSIENVSGGVGPRSNSPSEELQIRKVRPEINCAVSQARANGELRPPA